jgi:hypothetical protein
VDSAVRASSAALVTSVAGVVADARAEAEKCRDDDLTYAEMMENYVALGELLEAPPAPEVQNYEDDSRALMTRLIQLEHPMEFQWQQRWAQWCVKNMTTKGVTG